MILVPRSHSMPVPPEIVGEMEEMKLYYRDTQDVEGSLKMVPKNNYSTIEYALLKGLAKHKSTNNLLGAINFVSANVFL